jgi:hypothetical protein
LDGGNGPVNASGKRVIIDHNVVYQVITPICINDYGQSLIANNVLLATTDTDNAIVNGNGPSGSNGATNVIRNNIMNKGPNLTGWGGSYPSLSGATRSNNIENATGTTLTSLFVDPSTGTLANRNYRLKTGSPAIDGGVQIATTDAGGLNINETTGTPDQGAYEYGAATELGVGAGPGLGTGTGLKGEYFPNTTFSNVLKSQTDHEVNFDWGANAPKNWDGTTMSSMTSDFSVRWTGQIQAIEGGTYTISVLADDTIKVWIGTTTGTPLINQTAYSSAPTTATIALNAGQRYNIQIDFVDTGGGAVAKLSWKRPQASRTEIVPSSQLYPTQTVAISRKFDMGTGTSPTMTGYTGVGLQAYSSTLGYGWQSVTSIGTRDRGTPDALKGDFHLSTSPGTFLVDVPNGTYNVRVHMGDAWYAHDVMNISAEGTQVVSGVTTAVNQFVTKDFTATVSDGQLTLLFSDGGGSDYNWVCNAIEVTSP